MMSKDPVFSKTPIHLVIYIVIIIFQNVFFCVLQGYWTPHQLWLMQSHSLWRYFTHFIIVFSIKVLENSNSCPASKNNCWKSDDRQTTKNSFSPCVDLQRSCGSSCEWEVALGWLDWQWIVSWSCDRARARRGHIRRTSEVKFNTGSSFTRVKFNKSNFKEFWQGSSLSFEFLLNECHSKAQQLVHPDHSYSRCTVHAAFMLTAISTEKNDTNTLGMLYLLPEQWIIIDHRWIVAVLRSVVNGEGTTDYTYIVYSVL